MYEKNHILENNYQEVIDKLPSEIKDKISDWEFIYKGFHNYTFKVLYGNKLCQLRIPISDLVDSKIESMVYSKLGNYLYYSNGILIREWFEGIPLNEIRVTVSIQKLVLKKLKWFNEQAIELPKFDWNAYGKINNKYEKLANKYTQNCYLKTTHGDLVAKNILYDPIKKKVEFIDFEWCRKNHPGFDLMILIENLNFSPALIQKSFNLTSKNIAELGYLITKFREKGYQKVYADKLLKIYYEMPDYKDIKNFIYNDQFIQIKKKDRFNYLTKIKKFNNLEISIPIIFENDKLLVRKYYEKSSFDYSKNTLKLKNYFRKTDLKMIASAVKQLHKSKIKVSKNRIIERIWNYYKKAVKMKNDLVNLWLLKFLKIFKGFSNFEFLLNNFKFLPDNAVSHNDLHLGNLLKVDGKIKIIDFEYASENNYLFDLAYFCSNKNITKNQEDFFLKSYDGNINIVDYSRYKWLANVYAFLWSLNIERFNELDLTNNLKIIKQNLKFLN